MTVRRLVLALMALAVLVVVVIVATGEERDAAPAHAEFDLRAAKRQLAGAPAPLARLHAQSNQLLDGGPAAFAARLKRLRGHPVVVNKWASWCGPCRIEFPAFQRQATRLGKRIAFIGVNAGDSHDDAAAFLREQPLPYPSYEDPDEAIARALDMPKLYPVTLFIDAAGETAYIHQGQYRTAAELGADIERYLGAA